MKRSLNDYDQNRGGGMGKKLTEAAVPLGGLAGAAGMVGATKMMLDKPKQSKANSEAEAEMKRESRGVKKPANFDAMQESIQDAQDAAARKKISDMGYASGGKVGSASKRADGCATKGKTKGTMITMYGGGKC
jgi:hypothetical protein